MNDTMHDEVLSVLRGPCNTPKSQRNPFAGRCQLPAGHNGPHQWDPTALVNGASGENRGQVRDRMNRRVERIVALPG